MLLDKEELVDDQNVKPPFEVWRQTVSTVVIQQPHSRQKGQFASGKLEAELTLKQFLCFYFILVVNTSFIRQQKRRWEFQRGGGHRGMRTASEGEFLKPIWFYYYVSEYLKINVNNESTMVGGIRVRIRFRVRRGRRGFLVINLVNWTRAVLPVLGFSRQLFSTCLR